MRKNSLLPVLLLLPLALVVARAAGAQTTCSNRIGVTPAPSSLWGSLEPTDTGLLPRERDTTRFNGFQFANSSYPLFEDIDAAGSFLFTGTPYGFHVWAVDTPAHQRSPLQLWVIDAWKSEYLAWITPGEVDFINGAGSALAVANNKILYANAGLTGLTLWEFDTQTRARPKLLYQDFNEVFRSFGDVELVLAGGRAYAYVSVAGNRTQPTGLHVFDATAAQGFNGCLEDSSSAVRPCQGVYKGPAGSPSASGSLGASSPYLIWAPQFGSVVVYDASVSATSPAKVATLSSPGFVRDVEIWEHQGVYGVAYKNTDTLKIWDATTCLAGGSCAGLAGPPAYSENLTNGGDERLLFSKSSGGAFLDLVSTTACGGRARKDSLYDVSNLGSVHDIAPRHTAPAVGGGQVDLFGYYYMASPTGYQNAGAHGGVFVGNYFYQSDYTILNVFELVQQGAQVAVTGPASLFRDDDGVFTASAQFCPDAPNGVWTFDPITPTFVISGSGNPLTIRWSDTGAKSVTVSNNLCLGGTGSPATATLPVTVQSPEPLIVDLRLDGEVMPVPQVLSREVCQVLQFTATVEGKPTLVYDWKLLDVTSVIASATTAPFAWDSTPLNTPLLTSNKDLTLELTLSNGVPPAAIESRAVRITPLAALAYGAGVSQCLGVNAPCAIQNPATSAATTLYANAVGANQWRWQYRASSASTWIPIANFGTGQAVQSFTLPGPGTWEIESGIKNTCSGAEQTAVITVVVAANPLVASFSPFCPVGCFFDTPATVSFVDASTGNPESYQYDFTHATTNEATCSFGTPLSLKVSQFVYTSAGTFYPCLRVNATGVPSATYVHTGGVNVTDPPAPPPPPPPSASITVSCSPLSVETQQATSCSAFASNCSPGSSSWSWSTSGGAVSGSANSSSLQITWSTQGSKTVQATNSSCSGAVGTRTVTVTQAPPNQLRAGFAPNCNFAPGCRFDQGSAVVFNDTSTGSPTGYEYDFVHATTDSGSCAFGAAQPAPVGVHTFNTAGAFFPCLRVTKDGVSDTTVFTQGLTILPTAQPTVAVTCDPGRVTVGGGTSCTATAANCTPATSGWSWSTTGGSFAGASNTSAVQLNWPSAGTKPIAVTNSACEGASASTSVIVDPPPSLALSCSPTHVGMGGATSCTATAANCEPASSGWTWSTSGGSFAGPSTGAAAELSWGTIGSKAILVTNSECANASAASTVTVDPPPSIALSCSPTSLLPGAISTCTATAANCEPFAGGWSWNTNGGIFQGAFNSAQVGLSWATSGQRSVGVSNPGCPGATASASLDVELPPLVADFTWSPDPLRVGTPSLFDGSASNGGPDAYEWDFGQGTITGPSLLMEFPAIATYTVTLTVRRGAETASKTRVLEVLGPCVADKNTLCFGRGRFAVSVDWRTADGATGKGLTRDEHTGDSGLFYFFHPDNIELLAKVLNGCQFTDHYWVFLASATGLGYDLRVEDLIAGTTKVYSNEPGNPADAVADVLALETCAVGNPPGAGIRWAYPDSIGDADEIGGAESPPRGVGFGPLRPARAVALGGALGDQGAPLAEAGLAPSLVQVASGACVPGDTRFCGLGGRFQVEIEFRSQTGEVGLARRTPFSNDVSAVAYFFDPNNWEILVKLLDGCEITDHFWVFAAASTNQEYTLRVTDTERGVTKEYKNPPGRLSPAIIDTMAFATCH